MNVNILLVDRVDSYRKEVVLRLTQMGHRTVEARDGSHAIDAILNNNFAVVVLDNDLPGHTGAELVTTIRDIDKTAHLLLIVEPFFGEEASAKLLKKGVSKLLRGPISPQELAAHISDVLDDSRRSLSDPTSCGPERQGRDSPSQTGHDSWPGDRTVDAHIKAVRRNYQEKLPGELERLNAALIAARDDPSPGNLDIAHGIAHTLHGTAGTLGFHEISDITGYIDRMLKKLIAGGPFDPSLWSEIFNAYRRAETVPERLSLVVSIEPNTTNVAAIMVADTDAQMVKLIAEEAHNRCIDVREAHTAQQALEIAAAGRLDGAVMDINFSGDEHILHFIERMKQFEKMKRVPVALMSSDASVENRVAAAHAGATHFLNKPPNGDELIEVVQQFLAARAEQTYKVLVVDDDEPFREHIAAILKESGFAVTTLGDPKSVLEMAENLKPDIMLLDVMMPEISGFDVCRMLRSTTAWKEIPILFLTAEADPKVRLECFRAGGDDYIKKPVLKEELLARIDVRTERIRLYKERADKDALTTLPSRRAFIEMFKLRIAEGNRFNRPVSLCLIDIDHFKYVNDTFGHLTGDRVLASLGTLLASRFRDVDIRGRWGGEEFTVVFYNEGRDTAKLILTRFLEEFRKIEFVGEHGEKFFCTFSCGIAELPKDGTTRDELFRTADKRLYAAKELGRNRIITG